MAQTHRAEGQIEIKSHANKFFDLWTKRSNLISEWCPDKYPKIDLNEGASWHSLGAITTWHFFAVGRHDSVKTIVRAIDEEKRYVRYDYVEGHGLLRNSYKSLKSKIEVIPKANGQGCFVKWSFEYEKISKDAPNADVYIEFLLGCAKSIDARLRTA